VRRRKNRKKQGETRDAAYRDAVCFEGEIFNETENSAVVETLQSREGQIYTNRELHFKIGENWFRTEIPGSRENF